jgi:hypothetical protein
VSLEVSDDTAALLVAISPATIDRRLAADRASMTLRGCSHTKPGSLLKDAIPIRTWKNIQPTAVEVSTPWSSTTSGHG